LTLRFLNVALCRNLTAIRRHHIAENNGRVFRRPAPGRMRRLWPQGVTSFEVAIGAQAVTIPIGIVAAFFLAFTAIRVFDLRSQTTILGRRRRQHSSSPIQSRKSYDGHVTLTTPLGRCRVSSEQRFEASYIEFPFRADIRA
jgi:hypothetical protein